MVHLVYPATTGCSALKSHRAIEFCCRLANRHTAAFLSVKISQIARIVRVPYARAYLEHPYRWQHQSCLSVCFITLNAALSRDCRNTAQVNKHNRISAVSLRAGSIRGLVRTQDPLDLDSNLKRFTRRDLFSACRCKTERRGTLFLGWGLRVSQWGPLNPSVASATSEGVGPRLCPVPPLPVRFLPAK